MDAEDRFRYYYGEYSAQMFQIAGQIGIPQDEMEDLLQETFLSFYVHYSSRVSERAVRPLLLRIMKNRCIDYWKKKENRILDATNPDQLIRLLSEKPSMAGRDTLDVVIEELFFEDLKAALSAMKEDWRYVYVSYVFLGRPMDEISENLGISEAACRMRISRGRRYLAEYLKSSTLSYLPA